MTEFIIFDLIMYIQVGWFEIILNIKCSMNNHSGSFSQYNLLNIFCVKCPSYTPPGMLWFNGVFRGYKTGIMG